MPCKTYAHCIKAALFASAVILSSPASAQEAYIGQIGNENTAANLDLSAEATMVSHQEGTENLSVQANIAGQNTLVSIQQGELNRNLAITLGKGNFIAAAQFGMGNTAFGATVGTDNSLLTYQNGNMNSSQVLVTGNGAGASIIQTGNNLNTNLVVNDEFVASTGRARSGASTSPTPFNVQVNQPAGSEPVNAFVTRTATGDIMIKPGNATTVLRLSS